MIHLNVVVGTSDIELHQEASHHNWQRWDASYDAVLIGAIAGRWVAWASDARAD